MFAIHPLLAFLALTGLILVIFLPRFFSRKATSANVGMREIQGRVSSRLQEITQSQNVIKSFSLEKEFENRFRDESKQLLLASTRANFLVYMAQRIPNLLFFVMSLAFLGVSASMTMREMITLGDVISFQVLLLGLNGAITNMTFLAPIAVDGLASMERINQVLNERPDITLPARPVTAAPLRESIRFDNVRFSYASRGGEQSNTVLANLSFTIARGDFVLIAGPSGSGKTSTLLLMLRLYAPDSGEILFDGRDISQYDPESLRAKFGIVGQEAVLFDGNIRDNIKLGKLDADDGEIWTALVHAEIADMVSHLPEGLDTRVGERGTFLSGGQRQRLALARALVRRPSVLLLDEATSALDSSAEADLLETLKRISLESNITIVAVSHRMSFSSVANHVIVLGPGGIIDDQGTHLQLLGRNGIYADLWRSGHYDQPAQ
jgi:ATP-binding cassette subfamily B protein